MRIVTSSRVEEKYDAADMVVAPGGWCCCCCCWCHIGNMMRQDQEEETLDGTIGDDTEQEE